MITQIPTMNRFFAELAEYPNRLTKPTAGSTSELVREVNNPEGLRRLLLLLDLQIKR